MKHGKSRKRTSLWMKQALVFSAIILCSFAGMWIMTLRAASTVRELTYDRMREQAQYYLNMLNSEVEHAMNLQIEFLNDRKLPFLVEPDSGLSPYEQRDALLSASEKMYSIVSVSDLVKDCLLYLPDSGFKITSSGVWTMGEDDFDDMAHYTEQGDASLFYDGEDFCFVRLERNPLNGNGCKFALVLIFSTSEIQERLSYLNVGTAGGNFVYHAEQNVILTSDSNQSLASEILGKMKKEEDGMYLEVQEVSAQGEKYMLFAGGTGTLGSFIQYTEEDALLYKIHQSWSYFMVCLCVVSLMAAVFIVYTNRRIHRPMRLLTDAFRRVKEGNMDEHIKQPGKDEFAYLYDGFNDMEDELKRLIDEVYIQTNLVQKAQMKQMQAQINPHFLYNSFFTLSHRIKRGDYESAEEFALHLGKYFRYLTRNGSDYIPLEQEVEHARSYAAIQGIRFASRLTIEFQELPKAYASLMVPRLILQPLLENSFGHGLENKEEDGLLCVSFAESEDEFAIIVEDNGEEAGDEDILRLQEELRKGGQQELTGLLNIHRRLQIYFGNAGVRVKRSELGGMAVILWMERKTLK